MKIAISSYVEPKTLCRMTANKLTNEQVTTAVLTAMIKEVRLLSLLEMGRESHLFSI